jgi:hypothetical protein
VRTTVGQADLFGLNTATADQLKALPGIWDAYSEKIFKERLYQRKDELVQEEIIPQATYDKIGGMTHAGISVRLHQGRCCRIIGVSLRMNQFVHIFRTGSVSGRLSAIPFRPTT